MKQLFHAFVAALLAFLAGHSHAALIQHFDASNSTTVLLEGSTVLVIEDISGNGRDGTPGRGGVEYPSAVISPTGLTGLDMGSTRNDLIALPATVADEFLNFQDEAAARTGFSLAVAFIVGELTGDEQYVLGTTHVGFNVRIRSNGQLGLRLRNGNISSGNATVEPGDTVVLTLTYDAASGAYSLWDSLNRNLVTGSENSNIDFPEGNNLRLGEARTTGSSSNHFRGVVGEFQLHDEPLSASTAFELQRDLTLKWTGESVEIPPVAPGPGFRNIDRNPASIGSEYFTNLFVDSTDNKARTVEMGFLNGYLYMTTRGDALGTFSIWDISDEMDPQRVVNHEIGGKMHTGAIFIPSDDPFGNIYYYNNNSFINMRDPLEPVTEKPFGFDTGRAGARGLSVLPYEYSGGSVIRISDARLGQQIATLSEHGFEATPTPLGNLLFVSGLRGQARGVALYDISDPYDPQLLDVMAPRRWEDDGNPAYEYSVWKHYLVLGNALRGRDIGVVSFEDPTYIREVSFIRNLPGATRYGQYQDDYLFIGHGKYDMTPLDDGNDPQMVEVFSEQDHEYMLPLGNLIASAENTEQGRDYGFRMYPHTAQADSTPPRVYYHSPSAGALYQHVRSRVGVLIHETLDIATVNSSTFRVFPRDLADQSDVLGTLNVHDKDIINFTPDTELLPDTTYRVLLEGIADVSGNVMPAFSFDFSTSGPTDPPPVEIESISVSDYPALPNTAVDFTAVASGGMGNLEYRWDFGDGTPRTDWQGSTSITHSYSQEGHYTAKVQVRDQSGRFAKTLASVVTVVDTSVLATVRPISSSQFFVDEGSRRVWVVNPDSNTITAVNADSLAKVSEHTVCEDPRSVAPDAVGRLWITCHDDERVVLFDPQSGTVVNEVEFPYGSRPQDILIDPTGSTAFITLSGSNKVAQLSTSSLNVTTENAIASPHAMALVDDAATLLVTRFISNDDQGEVQLLSASGSLAPQSVLALAKDTNSEDTGDQGRGLPNYLDHISVSPDGRLAYVASKKDNVDRGVFREGNPLTFETTTRSIVSVIDLETGEERFDSRIDIDNASQPSALLFSPYGDYLFIALQGSNVIKVFDALAGNMISTLETELAPQSLAFDTTTYRLYVNNLNSRSVTVYDLDDSLRGGFLREPARTDISTVANELLSTSPGSNVLLGKQIFYNAADARMSNNAYISCAVCHQDGGHDGRTWDFTDRGEGFRNTTTLRGKGGIAQGRLHWSGNFDEVQDFEIEIRANFGGTGFIVSPNGNTAPVNASLGAPNAGRSTDLDALAAYLSSFDPDTLEPSPYRSADGALSDLAQAGQAVFDNLPCATCHRPAELFTDSGMGLRHDVGTIRPSSGNRLGGALDGLDTPSLLGLHATAPYLHDGIAPTLDRLFDPSKDPERSGEINGVHDLVNTHDLTAQEITALIAYLNELDGQDAQLIPGLLFRDRFQ